jgi:hypothetical protein
VLLLLCTTAVDWTKVKLANSVIATEAVPHASAFKPLFIKVFMIVLSSPGFGALHHAARRRHGVIYNYITR